MQKRRNAHPTIADRMADPLRHLEAADFGTWLDSLKNASPNHGTPPEAPAEDDCRPMPSTVEGIECYSNNKHNCIRTHVGVVVSRLRIGPGVRQASH